MMIGRGGMEPPTKRDGTREECRSEFSRTGRRGKAQPGTSRARKTLERAPPNGFHPDATPARRAALGILMSDRRVHSGIVFFDFDGTLIRGDSLLPFLSQVVGPRRTLWSLARALRIAARTNRTEPDRRSLVKAILLQQTLAGVPLAEAGAAAERLARRIRWNRSLVATLHQHKAAGRHVVIATGALDIYVPVLLQRLDVEVDALLATRLEAQDGVLTGRLASGNCVRNEKARQVAAYLRAHGPFGESWGYGNRPSDLPMLSLLDRRIIV